MDKVRNSNLELYRIVCMLLIVAHHYVVASGLRSEIASSPENFNSFFILSLGMWGKTGINCFLMITGYYMCKSTITIRKLVKLLLEIYIYKLCIYGIFLASGYETTSPIRIMKLLMPVWDFNSNFVSCFIAFYLTIPFWNILIQNMSRQQHKNLALLLLFLFSFLGSIPGFDISFNYISWFGVIYVISSFFRLYPSVLLEKKGLWAFSTLALVIISTLINYYMYIIGWGGTSFVQDSNKIFAVLVAISSFLWFKNIKIKHSRLINLCGASTFGVLLIHTNSDAMRQWLWKDLLRCKDYYNFPSFELVWVSCLVVLCIFIVCVLIDQIRILIIERPFFNIYDKRILKKQAI